MRKLVVLCTILLLVLTGCSKQGNVSSKDTLEKGSKPSVVQSNNDSVSSQQEQSPKTYKPSIPYSQGEDLNKVANNLITMYLEHYKNASDEPADLRLKDYRIQKAEVYKSDEAGFMFKAIFSVLPQMEGAYVAGNGTIGENGWVNDKCMFIKVIKSNNTYQMVGWGTSP